jgi:hypothetical protein
MYLFGHTALLNLVRERRAPPAWKPHGARLRYNLQGTHQDVQWAAPPAPRMPLASCTRMTLASSARIPLQKPMQRLYELT